MDQMNQDDKWMEGGINGRVHDGLKYENGGRMDGRVDDEWRDDQENR